MNSFKGFLHDHPEMQQKLNLNEGHVIVDKDDWRVIRGHFSHREDLSYFGFLHDHPGAQNKSDIGFDHVIVDLIDWEIIRRLNVQSGSFKDIPIEDILERLFIKNPGYEKDYDNDHPVFRNLIPPGAFRKKFKIKDIIDFKIYLVRSILQYVVSEISLRILIMRFKSFSLYKDPHKYFASIMFNKSEKSISRDERQTAKRVLFNSLYGKN